MSFNYSNAKLLLFLSTQYENTKIREKLSALINCAANGFVLMPSESYVENKIYDIKEINGSDGTATRDYCINQIKSFVDYILTKRPDAKIWIGTPHISSKNFNLVTDSPGEKQIYIIIKNYIDKVKQVIGTEKWNNNIQGFLYNQESIYATNFDYNNLMNNSEVKLMNDTAYYVRQECGKDLIFIPYLPAIKNPDLEGELFKRLGHVISQTACFDCAFIQAGFPTIWNSYGEKNVPTDKEIYDRISLAKKNVDAIAYSLDKSDENEPEEIKNCLYYRNFVITANHKSNSHCLIGAEYEYSYYKDLETTLNDNPTFDERLNSFFDNYLITILKALISF